MKGKIIILMLAIIVLSLSMVAAAPSGGNVTVGASTGGTSTTSTTVSINGGNVTSVDVNSDVVTSRWAGFFGDVSGSLFLADSSANNFYQWTIGSMTGAVVYATNASVTNWATLTPLTNADAPGYVNGVYSDNFTQTFADTESFVSGSYDIASTPYATTYNSSGVAGDLKTYALYADAATTVWAGKVVDDTDGFDGSAVDYQILLPAQTGTTYSFYMELP